MKKLIESEELFERILHFDSEGFIMSITTAGLDTSSEGEREGPSSGILPGHAYTLVSATRLSNGVKLLRIRNPWGNFEWTGDWGDASNLWTPALRKEMESKGFPTDNVDDGMFW